MLSEHKRNYLLAQWVSCACLLILLSSSVVAKSLPGLPETVNGGQPVTLSVYRLPRSDEAHDVSAKATLAVAQAYQRRYPNVSLRAFSALTPPSGAERAGDEQGILMAMAGGVGPDIMVVNFRQSETYISQHFLMPLDDLVAQWTATEEGKREFARIVPNDIIMDVIKRPGPDGNTHIWAIPPLLYSGALFCRKDILRNAGLDPNKPPKTWDELYRMCLKTCDPRKDITAFTLSNSWTLTPFIWSMGSDLMKWNEETKEWYASCDDEGAVVAAQFGWKLINQPWSICPHDDDHFDIDINTGVGVCAHGHRFTAEELKKKRLLYKGFCDPSYDHWALDKQTFYIAYLGDLRISLGNTDPALVGIVPIPLSPAGRRGTELNSSMLAINGSITDKGKIEAAWAYVRFTCSEEAKRIQTKVLVDGGFAQYLNPTWLRQFGYTQYLRDIPPGWEEAYKISIDTGRPEPYGKNAQMIYAELDLGWDQIKLLDSPDPVAIRRILKENTALTNERLLGHIAPKEKSKRDWTALFVVIGIAVLFVLLISFTLRTYGGALSDETKVSRAHARRITIALTVLAPALIGVVLFQYLPLARGSVIAFQDYTLLGQHRFIGVTNFGSVLFSAEFWKALFVSLKYALLVISLGFFTPVLLALFLHEIPRGSLFYRVIYFLPSVTSGVTILLLWKLFYTPTPHGPLNQLFDYLHIAPQQFLQDPQYALLWVVIPGIWAAIGPGSIIYLAAMKQIPDEYYEAADVDGAGFFTKFRVITMPFLKPLLIINFVGACIAAFKSFEPVWLLTNGGPAAHTNVLGLEIWRNSFVYMRYGYATAMGWLLASFLIGFTIFQLQYLSKVQFKLAKSD